MSPAWMLLLAACGEPAPAPAPPPEPADAVDPAEAARAARAAAEEAARAQRPPAPTRARYGLTLGESAHDAIQGWLHRHGLPCSGYPSPTRATFQYRCTGDLPEAVLDDRPGVTWTELLIVRAENAPAHYVATHRSYPTPDAAVADYHATLDALSATFGAPARDDRVADPTRLPAARIVRAVGEWRFRDLEVTATLLRTTTTVYTVMETWQIPGVEAAIPLHARTGSLSGAPGKRPPAWNPHVSEYPTWNERSNP
jgi:hypothetical protein